MQRRGPLLDNRLKDERSNRQVFNRQDRDADKHDKFNNSPRETNDGSDEDHPDKASYEVYAGQNVHGAFPPDVPAPPILVPVPGAGLDSSHPCSIQNILHLSFAQSSSFTGRWVRSSLPHQRWRCA